MTPIAIQLGEVIQPARIASRKWNDTERSLIDTRLGRIVAAIVGLAEEKRAKEAEEERRRRVHQEALACYEAQVHARNEERRRLSA